MGDDASDMKIFRVGCPMIPSQQIGGGGAAEV